MPTFANADVELLVSPRPAAPPGDGQSRWPLVATALLAGFFGQWGSVLLWVPPYQQATIWLPGSLTLGILLLVGTGLWPTVLAAAAAGQSAILSLLKVVSPGIALTLGAETALVVWLVALALRRLAGPSFGFATFRELLVHLGIGVLGGALVASAVFMTGAHLFGYRPPTFLVWRTFALAVVLGYLMVTPTVVLLVRNLPVFRQSTAARRLEGLANVVLIVLASTAVFSGSLWRATDWPVFALVIPPLLFWAAFRFGPLGAAGSALLVTVISTFGTAQGLGPFYDESAAENTLMLQLFMLGTGLPLLGLAVILDEQRRTLVVLRETHLRLRGLNRDLVVARETEAERIAGELHDDIGQRMALVSIELSRIRQAVGPERSVPLDEITRLQEQTSSISRSLRELSHQLHPTALHHAGLAIALQMAGEEVARVTGLDVTLTTDGDTSDLPGDVALSLFRVAQEGMGNAVRHARARAIRVSLARTADTVTLQVGDDGVGFLPGQVRHRNGLGIHSLIQRLSLVGGTVAIDSSPGEGTTLRAVVSLKAKPGA